MYHTHSQHTQQQHPPTQQTYHTHVDTTRCHMSHMYAHTYTLVMLSMHATYDSTACGMPAAFARRSTAHLLCECHVHVHPCIDTNPHSLISLHITYTSTVIAWFDHFLPAFSLIAHALDTTLLLSSFSVLLSFH